MGESTGHLSTDICRGLRAQAAVGAGGHHLTINGRLAALLRTAFFAPAAAIQASGSRDQRRAQQSQFLRVIETASC